METTFPYDRPRVSREEMRWLKYEHAAEHLWFADDIFGLKPKWVCEFASEVERRRAAVPFKMQSRVDLMSAETVQALHRAGCIEVWMGVESRLPENSNGHGQGNPRRSGGSGKREPSQRRNSRVLFSAVWLPRRELARHSENNRLGSRHSPRPVLGVSVAYPLPGTRFFIASAPNWARKPTGLDSEDLSMMFQGSYTDEFYRALHDALHAQVDTWHSGYNAGVAVKENDAHSAPRLDDLWERVVYLEKICRNSQPTVLDGFPSDSLVQLRLAPEFVHISSSEPPSGSD